MQALTCLMGGRHELAQVPNTLQEHTTGQGMGGLLGSLAARFFGDYLRSGSHEQSSFWVALALDRQRINKIVPKLRRPRLSQSKSSKTSFFFSKFSFDILFT